MSAMTQQGYSLDDEQDYTLTKPASASPGGSDAQVQFNDAGTLAGDAGLAWDKTNNRLAVNGVPAVPAQLTIISPTGATAFSIEDESSNQICYAAISEFGQPAVAFGDIGFAGNGITFFADNPNGVARINIAGASCVIGDNGSGLGTELTVDDANQKVTSNVDVEFTLDSIGPILMDRTTATKYRLYVDSGVLGIEAV